MVKWFAKQDVIYTKSTHSIFYDSSHMLNSMHTLAIILFPGLNTELETKREIERTGMRAEFFRWNEDVSKLKKYDGYVIGGGFSYEDRGRAGVIASLDPIMEHIKLQAEGGKPVLGICNGAQILVESGLVPGIDGTRQMMALARNKRIRNGVVLGTGYFNTWVRMKVCAEPKSCMFTWDLHEGQVLEAPIAHGEGRYTTLIPDLMLKLRDSGQMPLRYCSTNGAIINEFPDNPNGAEFNAAAICNPSGNVMAIMPHLERAELASLKLFSSLKSALDAKAKGQYKVSRGKISVKMPYKTLSEMVQKYDKPRKGFELLISLNITDNEAQTHEMVLRRIGITGAKIWRATHVEVGVKVASLITAKLTGGFEKMVRKLVHTGVVMNTNKERAIVSVGKKFYEYKPSKGTLAAMECPPEDNVYMLLVREREDFVGMSKFMTLQKRFKMEEVTEVKYGTLWAVTFDKEIHKKDREVAWKQIIESHLFFNPHRQVGMMA